MMFGRGLLLASAALLGVESRSGANNAEPCELLATLQAAGGQSVAFPAETAFDCLNSVPVDVEGDKKLIDELKVVWQWHSDITWLKNPPEDWEEGPLDMIAELDNIKAHLEDFESEYMVQLAIQRITIRTGDFHLNYVPDILQVFNWARDISIVALSDDGISMPKLYVTFDAIKVADGNLSTSDISEITKINGKDAFAYLEELAQWEQYRDTDGRLNSLWAKGDTLTPGSFMVSTVFDGAETNITFANGTEMEFMNTAHTRQDLEGLTDGKSFFDKFCQGNIFGAHADQSIWKPTYGRLGNKPRIPKGTYRKSRLNKRAMYSVDRPYSPPAVVEAESGAVAGYFLNGEGYDDVAVLKVITFDPQDDPYGLEFQAVVADFLEQCRTEGKERLILDLRENGGGSVQLMLDLFMQLFPHRKPWQGSRYRATPHYKLIGDAVSEIWNDDTMHDYYKEMWNATIKEHFRYWAYAHFLDAQNKNFESWEQYKGPELFHDDQYTAIFRYNLSNADDVSIRSGPFEFTDPSGLQTVFNHTSIVMFTDALCGSACASIYEELKNNAGVRSVVVGGRAIAGPMQAVAGTKGGEVIPIMRGIQQADHMRNISRTFDLTSYPGSEVTLDEFIDTPQLQMRAGNERNRFQMHLEMRKGDKSSTPLQYIYEAADCKIFYSHSTFVDPDAAWKHVWDAFVDPEVNCVQNSTGHESSISGGFKPYGPWELKDEDLPVPQSQNEGNVTLEQANEDPDKYDGAGSRIGASVMVALAVAVAVAMVQL